MNKRLWQELRVARGSFRVTVLMQLAAALFLMLQAWSFAQIINRVFLLGQPPAEVIGWFGWALVGVAGRAAATSASTVAAAHVATRVKASLRQRTLRHLSALGPAYLQGERSGELVTTLADGVEKLDSYFREYLPSILAALLIPLCIILVVLPLDLLTFVVLLFTAPLIPLFMVLIGMAAGELARRQHSRMSLLGAHFTDVMQGLTTLRLLNRSQHQITTIRHITESFRVATMNVLRVAFLSALSLELLATLSVAIVAVEIGVRLLYGGLLFEHALFLLVVAPEFYMPLRTLGARFHSGTEGAAVAERLYQVLDTPPPAAAAQPVPDWQSIAFEGVHFAYTPDRPALSGATLTIQRGQHVALVGPSGGGKSTLAALLLRFIAPTQGQITLDGRPLEQIDVEAWRGQLAWVSQKPYLFNATIAENIRMGQPEASDAAVMAAARAADAHDFILSLPQGYDTPIGERGALLSGGQAQRIAMARAFLKDAPLLILDEPTANLDAASESQVIAALRRLMHGRTVVSIAHRPSAIVHADAVYEVRAGQVSARPAAPVEPAVPVEAYSTANNPDEAV
ncbi:thiol reductant ABC exporter subunit CydD [Aggregatilineales bacterium SYSU G02658]